MKDKKYNYKGSTYYHTDKLYLYKFLDDYEKNSITIVEKMISGNTEYVKVLYSTGKYKESKGSIYAFNPQFVIKEDIEIGDYAHHFI